MFKDILSKKIQKRILCNVLSVKKLQSISILLYLMPIMNHSWSVPQQIFYFYILDYYYI